MILLNNEATAENPTNYFVNYSHETPVDQPPEVPHETFLLAKWPNPVGTMSFRRLKTTMDMELLRCQSPQVARKDLLAFLVAYNLIHYLMAEAGVLMARVGFEGTADAARNYSAEIRAAKSRNQCDELWIKLVASMAANLVPDRAGRREPMAVKGRPEPYARLNKPRHHYKGAPHRNGYRKNYLEARSRASNRWATRTGRPVVPRPLGRVKTLHHGWRKLGNDLAFRCCHRLSQG